MATACAMLWSTAAAELVRAADGEGTAAHPPPEPGEPGRTEEAGTPGDGAEPPLLAPPTAMTGRVLAAGTGQPLPGAFVSYAGCDAEATTDEQGVFSLLCAPGAGGSLVVYLDGYARAVLPLDEVLGVDEEIVVHLAGEARSAEGETVVRTERTYLVVERAPLAPAAGATTGTWDLSRRDVELSPGTMGDVAKAVHSLPGVAADSDLFATFSVRGGDPSETLWVVEGVEMERVNHLGGTFTAVHPGVLRSLRLWTAGAPASVASGLPSVLQAEYDAGDPTRWDGTLDASLVLGSAHLSGPLGPKGTRHSVAIFVRKSWFEPYLQVVRAVGLLDPGAEINVGFGDYGIVAALRGRREGAGLRVFVTHTHDRLHIGTGEGEGAIRFEHPIDLRGSTTAARLSGSTGADGLVEGQLAATFVHDSERRLQPAAFGEPRDLRTWRGDLDFSLRVGERGGPVVLVGGGSRLRSTVGEGVVLDPRVVAPWSHAPWGPYARRQLDASAATDGAGGAIFGDLRWDAIRGGPADLRAGLRVQWLSRRTHPTWSPQLSIALRTPLASTFRFGAALHHSDHREPLAADPKLQPEALPPARAFVATAAWEQLFPVGALLRVEGYFVHHDHLLHWDPQDLSATGPLFRAQGRGSAVGLDVAFALRKGRVGFVVSASASRARREYPRTDGSLVRYAPAYDQPLGLKVGGELRFGRRSRWRLMLSFELRAGRPRTEVTAVADPAGGYVLDAAAPDGARFPPFHELSARLEHCWPHPTGARTCLYLDVLNTTFGRAPIQWIYGDAGDGGEPPEPFVFRQLPIRPWVGWRTEF